MTAPALIIVNATVHTADGDRPTASAFAVADGRIAAVGGDDEIRALATDATEIRDLGGAAVIPGFVDVHNHHLLAGEGDLYELRFAPTATFDEIVEAVRSHAETIGADEWIVGEAFGSTLMDEFSRVEARHRIDEAAGGRPAMLTDDSHHNRFGNSRALELAGIGPDSIDPPGGRIVRDPVTGEPSGLLYESATLALTEAVDASLQRTPDRYRRSSARGIEILHSHGITAFQDAAATVEIMGALRDLDESGDLHAWVVSSMLSTTFLFANTPVGDELIARREEFRSPHHRPDFVKVALDGVPPTYTGAFLTPYVETPEHGACHCGTTTMPPEQLNDWLLHTAELGLGAKIHCTGDAAVRIALDAIEGARDAGHTDLLYQIAHGQFIDPADRPRFAQLGVTADISPFLWFPGVIPDAIDAVRPDDEAMRMHPNRELVDLGVLLASGSDWPVSVSPNPWESIQGLVTRADPLGRSPGVLWPEQAVTLQEAFAFCTINAARAMGIDDVAGSLAPGKSADFVVLNQDPFSVPVERIIDTVADETWFAGERVYERR